MPRMDQGRLKIVSGDNELDCLMVQPGGNPTESGKCSLGFWKYCL